MKTAYYWNIRLLYLGALLLEMLFFIPVLVPFWSGLGFTMQQIVTLESLFAITMVILEIPTGYFADRFGRKLSLIVSAVFSLVGISLLAFVTTYSQFILVEILTAIGVSFFSGASEALLYDSLTPEQQQQQYKKIQGTMFLTARIGALIGTAGGGLLAVYSLHLPFYASIIPLTIWLILSFGFKEPERHRHEHEHWNHFKRIVRESFIGNAKIRWLIIYSAIPTGFFLIAFWLYQKYMEVVQVPIMWFGIVLAAMNLVSGLGSHYAQELERILTPKGILYSIPILAGLAWFILGVIAVPWAVILMVVTSLLWGFVIPTLQHYLQLLTTSDRRATILSAMSMLRRLFFFMFAPLLGWIVDTSNVHMAFLAMAILVLGLSGVALVMLHRVKVLT